MRTTVELPDDMFRKAREQAERQGLDVEGFITKTIINAITGETARPEQPRSGRVALPLIRTKGKGPLKIADDIRNALEAQEDLARHAASLRR